MLYCVCARVWDIECSVYVVLRCCVCVSVVTVMTMGQGKDVSCV